MDLHDEILILHNNVTYKSNIGNLSTLLATYIKLIEFDNAISNLSSIINYYYSDAFLNKYYKKNELPSIFSTIDEINLLTSNGTYVLTSTANSKANALSTTSQITAWRETRFDKNNDIIVAGYTYMSGAWQGAEDKIAGAEHAEDVIRLDGLEIDDESKW